MKNTILNLLDKIPNKTIVNCDRQPYLRRWYLFRTKPFAIFLHRFFRSDEDRALHDHPWPFITFILWRGYIEHTQTCKENHCERPSHKSAKRKWPMMVCYRPAEWRHRVELVKGKPAWTIVFRFRERRMWGFWERTGFLPWNKWWQNNCE